MTREHYLLVRVDNKQDLRTVRKRIHLAYDDGSLTGNLADVPVRDADLHAVVASFWDLAVHAAPGWRDRTR